MLVTSALCWISFLALASTEETRLPLESRNDANEQQRLRGARRHPKWSHFFVMHEPKAAVNEGANGFFYQVGEGPTVVNRIRNFEPSFSNDAQNGRRQYSPEVRSILDKLQRFPKNQQLTERTSNQHSFPLGNADQANYNNDLPFRSSGTTSNQLPQNPNPGFLENYPREVNDPTFKIYTNQPHNVDILRTNTRPGLDEALLVVTLNGDSDEDPRHGSGSRDAHSSPGSSIDDIRIGITENGGRNIPHSTANVGETSLPNTFNSPSSFGHPEIKTPFTHNSRVHSPVDAPNDQNQSKLKEINLQNYKNSGSPGTPLELFDFDKGSKTSGALGVYDVPESQSPDLREQEFGTKHLFPSHAIAILPGIIDSGINGPISGNATQNTSTGINIVTPGYQNDNDTSEIIDGISNVETPSTMGGIGVRLKVTGDRSQTLSSNVTQNSTNQTTQNATASKKISEIAIVANISTTADSLLAVNRENFSSIDPQANRSKETVQHVMTESTPHNSLFGREDFRERENGDIYRHKSVPGPMNEAHVNIRNISPHSLPPHTSIQIYPSSDQSQIPQGGNVQYDTNIHIHAPPTRRPNQHAFIEGNRPLSHSLRIHPYTFHHPESKSIHVDRTREHGYPQLSTNENPLGQVYVLYPFQAFNTPRAQEHEGKDILPANVGLNHRPSHSLVIHPSSYLSTDRNLAIQNKFIRNSYRDQIPEDHRSRGDVHANFHPDVNSLLVRQAVSQYEPENFESPSDDPGIKRGDQVIQNAYNGRQSHQFNIPSRPDQHSHGYIDTKLQLPPLNFRFHITPVEDDDRISSEKSDVDSRSNLPIQTIIPLSRPIPYQRRLPNLDLRNRHENISTQMKAEDLNKDSPQILLIDLTTPTSSSDEGIEESESPFMNEKNSNEQFITSVTTMEQSKQDDTGKSFPEDIIPKSEKDLGSLLNSSVIQSNTKSQDLDKDVLILEEISNKQEDFLTTKNILISTSPSLPQSTSGQEAEITTSEGGVNQFTTTSISMEPKSIFTQFSNGKVLPNEGAVTGDTFIKLENSPIIPPTMFTMNVEDGTTMEPSFSISTVVEDSTPDSTETQEVSRKSNTNILIVQDELGALPSTTTESTNGDVDAPESKTTVREIVDIATSGENIPEENAFATESSISDSKSTIAVTIIPLSTHFETSDGKTSIGDLEPSSIEVSSTVSSAKVRENNKDSENGITISLDTIGDLPVLIFSENSGSDKISDSRTIVAKDVDKNEKLEETLDLTANKSAKHYTEQEKMDLDLELNIRKQFFGNSKADIPIIHISKDNNDVIITQPNSSVISEDITLDERVKTTNVNSLYEKTIKGVKETNFADYSTYTFVENAEVSKSNEYSQKSVETKTDQENLSEREFLLTRSSPSESVQNTNDTDVNEKISEMAGNSHAITDITSKSSRNFEIFGDIGMTNNAMHDTAEIGLVSILVSDEVPDDSNLTTTATSSTRSLDDENSATTLDNEKNSGTEKGKINGKDFITSGTTQIVPHDVDKNKFNTPTNSEKELSTMPRSFSQESTSSSIATVELNEKLLSLKNDKNFIKNGEEVSTKSKNVREEPLTPKENDTASFQGSFPISNESKVSQGQRESPTFSEAFAHNQAEAEATNNENSMLLTTIEDTLKETLPAERNLSDHSTQASSDLPSGHSVH